MDNIRFDHEYFMIYELINFNTGEIISSGRKRIHFFRFDYMKDFGKLLVNNLHWKDSVSLKISFCPVIEEIPFTFD